MSEIEWPQKFVHCLECGMLAVSRVWLTDADEDGPAWPLPCVHGQHHGPTQTILVEPIEGQDA